MRELRAIWYNLPVWDEHSTNPLEVSKAEWRSGFKSKLDNQVYKMHAGNLPEHLKINPDYEVSGFNASLTLVVVLKFICFLPNSVLSVRFSRHSSTFTV